MLESSFEFAVIFISWHVCLKVFVVSIIDILCCTSSLNYFQCIHFYFSPNPPSTRDFVALSILLHPFYLHGLGYRLYA